MNALLQGSDSSFIDNIIFPRTGLAYSGSNSKALLWLQNSKGHYFPNQYIYKGTKSIILYAHGNGGTLGDFKSIVVLYSTWYVLS